MNKLLPPVAGAALVVASGYGWLRYQGAVPLLPSARPAATAEDPVLPAKRPVPPQAPQVVLAQTKLGFDLLSRLAKAQPGQNVFISPFSISLALSMAYHGSGGETRKAMAATMGLAGLDIEAVNVANAALLSDLASADPKAQLSIADSAWAKKGVLFYPEYVQRNRDFYGAVAKSLDFRAPASVEAINSWVSDSTRGKIAKVIDKIDDDAILFLVNAVYFKGSWTSAFKKSATRDDDFTPASGGKKNIPFMRRTLSTPYFQGEGFQAVSLPYGSGRFSMYVFLPDEGSSLDALDRRLSAQTWEAWMKRFRPEQVALALPRFKVEFSLELNAVLKDLGMSLAFDPRQADFKKMCPLPQPGIENVFIEKVIHKTFVEVNEEGTEAAAVTGVAMGALASVAPPPKAMKVDRPFLCAIRDNQTGTLLFLGAIVDPS